MNDYFCERQSRQRKNYGSIKWIKKICWTFTVTWLCFLISLKLKCTYVYLYMYIFLFKKTIRNFTLNKPQWYLSGLCLYEILLLCKIANTAHFFFILEGKTVVKVLGILKIGQIIFLHLFGSLFFYYDLILKSWHIFQT